MGTNVVFLDVDGVINLVWPMPRKIYDDRRYDEEFDVFEKHGYRILQWPNHKAIDLLNKLFKEANCKVVISSSWRSRVDDTQSRLQKTFAYDGLHADIIGATPELYAICRGNEIKAWIDNHPEIEIDNYVIIDDEEMMRDDQQDNFIKTNPYDGFDFQNYEDAMKIFGVTHNSADRGSDYYEPKEEE